MAPPTGPLNLDVEAISGIAGSVSIACWVVVFTPQIIENFRRGNADGLSLRFIIIWLLGDIFNILGAVLQGVLPTMIILAVYYTIADIVLLGQCFYYRGFTWHDEVIPPPPKPHPNGRAPNERTGLLAPDHREWRDPNWTDNMAHLNPTMPLVSEEEPSPPPTPPTRLQRVLFNTLAVLMVVGAGVLGWALSRNYSGGGKDDDSSKTPGDGIRFDLWGQIFGYFCAVLYLGSRLPQLLLNWRRKSTEGVSMLFFLFACLGNLTYVLSIFAYEPHDHCKKEKCKHGEAEHIYGQYILVNLSWLAGSLGTLLLDMGIFVQFFMYSKNDEDSDIIEEEDEEDDGVDEQRWSQRPVLERNNSEFSR